MHKLWICAPNDPVTLDHICAAIVGLGVEVSSLAKSGNLYAESTGATTIIALKAKNLSSKLGNAKILDRLKKAIQHYEYYGIVISNSKDGTSSWNPGNTTHSQFTDRNYGTVLEDFQDYKPPTMEEKQAQEKKDWEFDEQKFREAARVAKELEKEQEQETPKDTSDVVLDFDLLLQVVKKTAEMSDVFFDSEQKQRKGLVLQLEALGSTETLREALKKPEGVKKVASSVLNTQDEKLDPSVSKFQRKNSKILKDVDGKKIHYVKAVTMEDIEKSNGSFRRVT